MSALRRCEFWVYALAACRQVRNVSDSRCGRPPADQGFSRYGGTTTAGPSGINKEVSNMTAMLETPPPMVDASRREWDVRVRGDTVQVFIHDASTVESHDLNPGDPWSWCAISLRAEHARELALELQDAAQQVKEVVLSEWGLG